MTPDKVIAAIVGTFTLISLLFGIVRYFINLGNKLDTISQDVKTLKNQQQKQWEKIDNIKRDHQTEKENRIRIESEINHQKEIMKELRSTNRFKLNEVLEGEAG